MSTNEFLPFAKPCIGEEEIQEVADTMRSGWLTTGAQTKRFESSFAEFVGASHALSTNSATAGLHLSLDAVGVGPGDKVITVPYTFTATAEVVRYLGADPCFVDIDATTLNIDVAAVEQALGRTPNVKAILPVHFAGLACDMKQLKELGRLHSVPIVEDAAHALPTTCNGEMIGSQGDITVFSFYATKTVTTGEGGMVTTDNSDWAERIRTMRLHGISRDVFDRYRSELPSWYYEVVAPGFKYNMTDIAASIGIHQLNKAEAFRSRREEIADCYFSAFEDLPLRLPARARPGDKHAWHLYVIQLDDSRLTISRDDFIERLSSEFKIGTSVHFIPLHIQPYWRDRYQLSPEDFPVSLSAYEHAISLPIYPSMTDAHTQRVVDAVKTLCRQFRR